MSTEDTVGAMAGCRWSRAHGHRGQAMPVRPTAISARVQQPQEAGRPAQQRSPALEGPHLHRPSWAHLGQGPMQLRPALQQEAMQDQPSSAAAAGSLPDTVPGRDTAAATAATTTTEAACQTSMPPGSEQPQAASTEEALQRLLELQLENARMRKQVQMAQRSNEQVLSRHMGLQQRVQQLVKELGCMQSDKADQQRVLQWRGQEVARLEGDVTRLQEQGVVAGDVISRLTSENSKLEQALQQLKQQQAALLAESSALQQQLEQLAAEKAALAADYNTLQQQAGQQVAELQAGNSSMQQQVQQQQTDMAELREQQHQLQQQVEARSQQLAGVLEERNQLQQQLEETGQQLAGVQEANNQLQQQVEVRGQQLAGVQEERNQLQQQLEETGQQLAGVQEANNQLQQQVVVRGQQLAEVQEERNQLHQQLEGRDEQLAEIQGHSTQLQQQAEQQQALLATASVEKQRLQQQVEEDQLQLSVLTVERDDLQQRVEKQQQQIADMQLAAQQQGQALQNARAVEGKLLQQMQGQEQRHQQQVAQLEGANQQLQQGMQQQQERHGQEVAQLTGANEQLQQQMQQQEQRHQQELAQLRSKTGQLQQQMQQQKEHHGEEVAQLMGIIQQLLQGGQQSPPPQQQQEEEGEEVQQQQQQQGQQQRQAAQQATPTSKLQDEMATFEERVELVGSSLRLVTRGTTFSGLMPGSHQRQQQRVPLQPLSNSQLELAGSQPQEKACVAPATCSIPVAARPKRFSRRSSSNSFCSSVYGVRPSSSGGSGCSQVGCRLVRSCMSSFAAAPHPASSAGSQAHGQDMGQGPASSAATAVAAAAVTPPPQPSPAAAAAAAEAAVAAAAAPAAAVALVTRFGNIEVYVSRAWQAMCGQLPSSDEDGSELLTPDNLDYLHLAWPYNIGQKLGSGGEGTVYGLRRGEALLSSSQGGAAGSRVPVAVKVTPLQDASAQARFLQGVQNSMAMAAALPCALPVFAAWIQPREDVESEAVLAHVPQGCKYVGITLMPQMSISVEDLAEGLRASNIPGTARELVKLAMQLYRAGLGAVSCNWHPRDFKGPNVLVGPQGQVFLSDTGDAMNPTPQEQQQGYVSRWSASTYGYSSPEQLCASRDVSLLSNDAFMVAVAPLVTLLGCEDYCRLLIQGWQPNLGTSPILCLYPAGHVNLQEQQFQRLQAVVYGWVEVNQTGNSLLYDWLYVVFAQLVPQPGARLSPAAALARLEQLGQAYAGTDPELVAAMCGM